MQTDVFLVIGLALLILSVPAMLSALTERRAPRASAIIVLIGGALLWLAISGKPGGYTIQDIPRAVARVVASVLN